MTIDDKIRDEKAAKISAWSSGKIDKNEFLTGKEILPTDQSSMIEQAKLIYSPLGKNIKKTSENN